MRKDLVKVMFKVSPHQLEALRKEAARRMVDRGVGRIDASEVLREAVELWLAKKGGRS